MKKGKTETPSWHSMSVGLKLGVLLAFLIATKSGIAQTPETKPVKTPSPEQRMRDSLINANWNMFNIAQENYFDRVDKKYTMGRFFNKKEIAQLNEIMTPYLLKMAGRSDAEYKYVKMNMPITKKLSLNTFVEMVYIMGVAPEDLAPMDMIFDQGHLYLFNDRERQNLFEQLLEESDAGMIIDYVMPNYEIPEFQAIRKKYDRNAYQIDSLNRIVTQGHQTLGQSVHQFDKMRTQWPNNARYVLKR